MRIVAIDTETADPKRDSICQLALVVIEDGQVAQEWSSLVRPPRGVHPENARVHGLTMAKLAGARPFRPVWEEALPLLAGADCLIAHNAKFDQSVLDASCTAAGLAIVTIPWTCTVVMARSAWPSLPSHKLNVVAKHLGLELQHHDALSDARACARIYLAARQLQDERAARPAAPMVPVLPRVERQHMEKGGILWCWVVESDRAGLTINGKPLIIVRQEEPTRWLIQLGRHVLDMRLGPGSLGRFDALLLEALRAAVTVMKQAGIQLAADAWQRIVEARPRRRDTDGQLDVSATPRSTPTPSLAPQGGDQGGPRPAEVST